MTPIVLETVAPVVPAAASSFPMTKGTPAEISRAIAELREMESFFATLPWA